MSWSISFNTDGAHFYADLGAIEGGQSGYAENESKEQVEAAKGAVAMLIGSGALGNDSKGFTVSVNGHANPSHEPADGWTNDTITITVTQSKDIPVAVLEPTQDEAVQEQVDAVTETDAAVVTTAVPVDPPAPVVSVDPAPVDTPPAA